VSELAKALCAVMSRVRYVPETGRNQFHRYSYASDEDLLSVLQPAMADAGLAMVPTRVESHTVEHSADQKGKAQWRTEVLVTYALMHASGETVTIQAPGCGIDGEDKGVYKAMTGALKYALRHTFLVPTGQDAERAEEPAPRQRPQPAQRRDTPPPSPSPTSGAAEPASGGGQRGHHPSWEADKRPFFAAVGALTDPKLPDYAEWAAWCEEHTWPRRDGSPATGRPSSLPKPDREALYQWLRNPDHRRQVLEWAARQSAGEAA
jgi:hypothetical protein